MVPLSTFSCGHDVMFLRRASSTADVVSDLRYWDCQGFFLIPVIHAHLSISGLEMSAIGVAFRQLKPFQRCRGGKHKANQGGLAPRHRQRPPTYRDPFFPSLVPESHCKNRHSIHYSSSCPKKYIYMYSIGDTAMVIVKFRLRWPHTWRYALHSLSRPTMTSGRLG